MMATSMRPLAAMSFSAMRALMNGIETNMASHAPVVVATSLKLFVAAFPTTLSLSISFVLLTNLSW